MRYFFHVHDGNDHLDTDGMEWADDDLAKRAGARIFGQIVGGGGPVSIWDGPDWTLEIVREDGVTIGTLRAANAFRD